MKFLVDECLSVELVTVAAEAGYEAHHVAHVGKAGWKDWNVLRHACENDFVLVTKNGGQDRFGLDDMPAQFPAARNTRFHIEEEVRALNNVLRGFCKLIVSIE